MSEEAAGEIQPEDRYDEALDFARSRRALRPIAVYPERYASYRRYQGHHAEMRSGAQRWL